MATLASFLAILGAWLAVTEFEGLYPPLVKPLLMPSPGRVLATLVHAAASPS
jgi:ABC-type nitrate/sulfonate/bicarbonate transport system permease component